MIKGYKILLILIDMHTTTATLSVIMGEISFGTGNVVIFSRIHRRQSFWSILK